MDNKDVMVFQIEDYDGGVLFSFAVNTVTKEVVSTDMCCVADIDEDDVFNTGGTKVRIQSEYEL